ncbi:MAG: sulfatase-like hydrolase/transferase [Acidobacteriota bacterium]
MKGTVVNPGKLKGGRSPVSAGTRTENGDSPLFSRLLVVLLIVGVAVAGWLWMLTRGSGSVLVARLPDQNVLLNTIDTLRADALACYGGQAATPALDALAGSGERFTFAHAHAVNTLPAHASILTGEYPFVHGIHDNSGFRLKEGSRTIATLLKAHGYITGAFIGAFPLDRRFGLAQGFDVYDDKVPSGRADAPLDLIMPERRAEAVVSLARNWIGRQRGRWFAWVHVFDPHAPYAPPPPYDREYSAREYHGEVAYTDHALEPLLDDARRSQRPTLVIVTGDHGEALGDHGELTHGVFAYEATLRIPLIVAQVGGGRGAGKGVTSDASARHVDILPTVLDALTLPMPASLPGHSLISRDPDRTSDSYFEAMMPALTRGWAPLSGVLAGRKKFIELPIPELYNMEADPGESTNLVDREPGTRRTMEARLRAFGAGPLPAAAPEDPDAASRLRALGYASGSGPAKPRYTEEDDPKRLITFDRELHDALQMREQHRYADAIRVFSSIVNRRPAMSAAWGYLANSQWESGDRPGAVATLERAIGSSGASPELRRQLGLYLAESGQPQRALSLLEGVNPDADTLNAIGIALARGGDGAAAERAFNRVLQGDPANAVALQNIGTLQLQRQNAAAAASSFARALRADPQLPEAWTGLGVARMRLGEREGAFDAWRRAVEIDPRNFDALYNLGTELISAGRGEEAIPYLQQFVATAPPAVYGAEIERIRHFLASRQR